MIVYVLVQGDSYDRAEVLGVFATNEAARRDAEQREPKRTFAWEVFDGHDVAFSGRLGKGPLYTYDVEVHEVKS